MGSIKLYTLIMGVALGVFPSHQSEDDSLETHPQEGTRRIDIPEVVLQLKYNKGELNKIYLTQFRKEKEVWNPSVSAQSNLCVDLCHAGLGGEACGASCLQLVPVGLQSALLKPNLTSFVYGHPRYSVCPALCANQLGTPLCNCHDDTDDSKKDDNSEKSDSSTTTDHSEHGVDWSAVCTAFCSDGYTLNGCPACDSSTTSEAIAMASTRVLNSNEGWVAWCNVQCPQGHGGAACNCDRTPFQ